MTFLTESTLQWFNMAVELKENDGVHEAWSTSWVEFVKELRNTFRIANLKIEATEVLDALCMKPSDRISTYNVKFMAMLRVFSGVMRPCATGTTRVSLIVSRISFPPMRLESHGPILT
jgi:hypothetical protein